MKDVIQILREELKKKNSEIGITTLEDVSNPLAKARDL